jgi:DNA-binding response OmpR family regulator
MRILLVEDDKGTSRFIEKGFSEAGFTVDTVYDGAAGEFLAADQSYDLISLDIMLPRMDGFTLLKTIRKKGVLTPVIFLTAKSEQKDIISGFDLGADDYLVKPFTFAELFARSKAIMRRGKAPAQEHHVSVANLTIDKLTRKATRGGKTIELSNMEFKLLCYLADNSGQVLTRTMILESVWGYNFDINSNVIDVHINRLRVKIDKEFSPQLIHTIKGVGYVLEDRA